ncbi:hypothetical protein MTO96_032857 [Rhipicephalus appendiculatus]
MHVRFDLNAAPEQSTISTTSRNPGENNADAGIAKPVSAADALRLRAMLNSGVRDDNACEASLVKTYKTQRKLSQPQSGKRSPAGTSGTSERSSTPNKSEKGRGIIDVNTPQCRHASAPAVTKEGKRSSIRQSKRKSSRKKVTNPTAAQTAAKEPGLGTTSTGKTSESRGIPGHYCAHSEEPAMNHVDVRTSSSKGASSQIPEKPKTSDDAVSFSHDIT